MNRSVYKYLPHRKVSIFGNIFHFECNEELLLVTRKYRLVIMTSLILCSLLSVATALISRKHKINDVTLTSRSYHMTSRSSPVVLNEHDKIH